MAATGRKQGKMRGGQDTLPRRSVTTREAKNRLSAVIREVTAGTDIAVTSDGEPAVVIVAAQRYRELRRHKNGILDFFRKSPLAGTNLDTERSQETGRDIDLS